MVKNLQDAQFETATAKGLVVVDFWAPWCGPCRMQGPIIDRLSEELEGEVEFFKMNVDEEQQVAKEFGIMSIPTLIVKKDGTVVEKLVGLHDEVRLKDVLERHK